MNTHKSISIICAILVIALSLMLFGCAKPAAPTTPVTTTPAATTPKPTTPAVTTPAATTPAPTKPAPVPAAEVIKWKFQDLNQVGSTEYSNVETWIKWVQDASQGRIQISHYVGGAIAKAPDIIDSLREGIIDAGDTYPGYYKGTMPEAAIASGFPGIVKSTVEWDRILFDLGMLEPLREAYAEKGAYIIAPWDNGGFSIWATKPLKTLADFKGLKVRGTGDIATMFTNMGAAAVFMPHEESFTALQLGTVTAYCTALTVFQSMKHYEVTKYVMTPAVQGVGQCLYSVGVKSLNKLPADLQALVKAMGPALSWQANRTMAMATQQILNSGGKLGFQTAAMDPEVVQRMTDEGAKILDTYIGKSPRVDKMIGIIKQHMKDMGYIK